MIAVLNLKTQTCCEALSFTCAKRCMKPTKAQRCQNIELSRLSEANIPGKGNKIRMAWADKGSMMLRKVLKLKRSQNLQTVVRVKCHRITSFTPSSSSAVSNGWQISLTKRTTRVLHRAWRFPRFQKGSEQKSVTFHIISHLTSPWNSGFKVSSLQSLGLPSLHLAGVASFRIVSLSFRVFQRMFAHLKADQAAHLRCTEADKCFMSCVNCFEALRRITIPKSIALCAILHQITMSEEICLECHANTSLHVFAAHIFFTRPRLLSKWNWAKGLLMVHNAQFVWSFVAKGLKMLYWKTYLKLRLVQYLQSSMCLLLASASGCPSYHLPLCVFPQCYTFYMSRHVAYAFQVSYHITSKETPIFAGPTAAAKPPSDFDGSSRLTRQGSSHRLQLQCNKQVDIYVKHVMRWCEMWRERQRVQRGKKANNVSDCLMCASQKKYNFSQKLGQNKPYQHSKSFQGSLSGVRVSMIFARPCS